MNNELDKENKIIEKLSKKIATLYTLDPHEEMREVTEDILRFPHTQSKIKEDIQKYKRRIFIFTYPSDGLQIKGFINFSESAMSQSVLFLLRGGNREWGLMSPATNLAIDKNLTVVSTTYRGGINEGTDEYGGDDVNDVKNLVDFFPQLQQQLPLPKVDKKYILGASRGGMQMFLALARFPYLQNYFNKAVSLSGILDIKMQIKHRHDMKKLFIDDFGLEMGVNEEEWVKKRNPLFTVPLLKKTLPILIIQGTKDSRIDLSEGIHMTEALKKNGNHVEYLEIDSDHCLQALPNRMELITKWLKK